MVNYDPVYRINDVQANIFPAIINNYSEDNADYDFSVYILGKFRRKALKLAECIDDGGNFETDIKLAYEKHLGYLDIIKEKKEKCQ